MIKEEARTVFDSPVIVAGICHYVNVSLDDQNFQELSLELYKGTSAPSEGDRDETNYYEWKYDKNSQQWTDVNEYGGSSYINESLSQKNGNNYSFCIGINPNFISETIHYTNKFDNIVYYENCTLKIYKDCYVVEYGNCELTIPNDEDNIPKCRNDCEHKRKDASLHCDGYVIRKMHDIVSYANAETLDLEQYKDAPDIIDDVIKELIPWDAALMNRYELCVGIDD